ncbi:MAG: ABC transporter ATP-binding protein [Pseudomonadota bacterium]
MSNPTLQVQSLVKSYPSAGGAAARALTGVSFEVAQGEFFTLLGPSGCGKTTTLQCIAGLEVPSGGRIAMDGQTVYSSADNTLVPANRRDLGMVFQSYAIWPHMTVFENVAFPLIHGPRKTTQLEISRRVGEALDRVKLGHLASRPAPLLSGGQQQRVALARALVNAPRLLLLDEPLSNLDAKLRDLMRIELRQLVKSLGITTIFVSHDQVEAMSMSDRVALMRDGQIVQLGAPREIYLKPRSAFTANFMGHSNMVSGRLVEPDLVETLLGPLRVGRSELPVGSNVLVVVRPQSMEVRRAGCAAAPNQFAAQVAGLSFLGDEIEVDVSCGPMHLRMVTGSFGDLAVGDNILIELLPERLAVVPEDSQAS